MKKTSNTIRVGVFRRGNLSAKFKDDQSSSSNVQEHANHHPVREPTNHHLEKEKSNHQLEKEQTNHQPVKEQVRDYSIFSLNITKSGRIRRLLMRNTPELSNES